jgi:uroporphyrinogen decarboxylase
LLRLELRRKPAPVTVCQVPPTRGQQAGAVLPPFLAACHCEPATHTPVWFMRQAGRSLPEYRARRGTGSILDAIRNPELAAELTLQPVQRYGVDAAVLFSDIIVPLQPFGADIAPGAGPVIERPFREARDLDRLRHEDTSYVEAAVRLAVSELRVPLIGFAGGPFTLASYLVEGGPSRDFLLTKTLMWAEPALWASLMGRLAEIAGASLRAQAQAGASAVQVFESWGGALSPADYHRFVLPALKTMLCSVADLGVPRVVFGTGAGELVTLFVEAGAEVVGVDWRLPLDAARARAGPGVALQGNLDPVACLAPWPALASQAREVLALGGQRGHIFNLGHGVLPSTDPDQLARLVDLVHEETTR